MPSRKQDTGTAWFIDSSTRAVQLALTEYQSLEGLSDHALTERINEAIGGGLNKESTRRFRRGEQCPTRKRMDSIKAFLAGESERAAREFASEERAQDAVRFHYGGLPAKCRPKAIRSVTGTYSAPHPCDDGETILTIKARKDGRLVAEETIYGGRHPRKCYGFGVLSAELRISLKMKCAETAFTHEYILLKDNEALGTGAPVRELVLGRFGFPLEIDEESSNPAREMHDALARNILTFVRIEGESAQLQTEPAGPAESGAAATCAAGEADGEHS